MIETVSDHVIGMGLFGVVVTLAKQVGKFNLCAVVM